MRTRFIKTLTKLAMRDERICLVVGDLGYSVVEEFAERFPDRFVNAGVAEQSMTGLAAGWAMTGKVVFTYSIANFPTLRCLEQIRNDVCAHKLPVKIVAIGGGFAYGAHGYTHHGLEDISAMRSLPNMAVCSPADSTECEGLVRWMMDWDGPAYLRLGRNNEPILHPGDVGLATDRFPILRKGTDIVFMATGAVLGEALKAANMLAERGLQAGVVSAPIIKPFPVNAVEAIGRVTPVILTVEEHSAYGGLGSAVAEVLAETQPGARLVRCHAPEKVNAIGSQAYMQKAAGLDADSLVRRAVQAFVKSTGEHRVVRPSITIQAGSHAPA